MLFQVLRQYFYLDLYPFEDNGFLESADYTLSVALEVLVGVSFMFAVL